MDRSSIDFIARLCFWEYVEKEPLFVYEGWVSYQNFFFFFLQTLFPLTIQATSCYKERVNDSFNDFTKSILQ